MRSWMIGLVLGLLPVPLLPQLPDPGVTLLLAGVGLAGLRGGTIPWRLLSGIALGGALGLSHGQSLLDHRIRDACVGLSLDVSGQVASLPRRSQLPDGSPRQRFEFAIDDVAPRSCDGPRRVLLSYYGPETIIPGDHWQFEVSLSKPWGLANPGSFNMQAWFAQTGIDAVGHVRGGRGSRLPHPPDLLHLPDRLRQQISGRIARLPLDADVRAIFAAVTVADKSAIDSELWSLFQQFGINHLLVISGLHIGLVAGAGILAGGLAGRVLLLAGVYCSWLPPALALVASCAYTALAGFSVSTQRALCMLLCFIVAGLAGRSTRSGNNLLLAACVVLGCNPLASLGSGFWLSFAAVAALLWLACWQRGQRRWLRLLWTHGFMSLAMLPLGAWWFAGSSLVAGPANLLMVPLVGIVIVPVALLAVLAAYLFPPAEMLLWHLAAWPLQHLLPAAARVASEGGDWLFLRLAPSLPDVLLAVLGVTLLAVPGSAAARALAALLVLPLVLARAPVGSGRGAGIPAGNTRVTVLDVGQGTAVVVRAPGRVMVYDTGGGDPGGDNMAAAVILPYLRLHGETALDTLVISHPDNDHSAGARTLLGAMPVGRVYYGGKSQDLAGGRPCAAGQAWQWPGGQRFQFLAPAPGEVLPSNDSSCVLLLEVAGHRLLLAGDIEGDRERELVRYWGGALASDWLLVAHHGSRTSSSHALLKAARPATAAISSGYANRFGHPHADVLQRLLQGGARVDDTVTGGALEYELVPGRPLQARRYRDQVKRFWM